MNADENNCIAAASIDEEEVEGVVHVVAPIADDAGDHAHDDDDDDYNVNKEINQNQENENNRKLIDCENEINDVDNNVAVDDDDDDVVNNIDNFVKISMDT